MKVLVLLVAAVVAADNQGAISLVRASEWTSPITIFSSNGYDGTGATDTGNQWGYDIGIKDDGNSFASTTPFLHWSIQNRSFYNYDTGEQWLAIRHILETPIFSDDVITFGIAFFYDEDGSSTFTGQKQSGSGVAYADTAECSVEINTKNTVFWDQTIEDGYYERDSADSAVNTYYTDSQQDWIVYIEDDDENNLFCEWDQTVYAEWFPDDDATKKSETPYQCTRMYCTMTRQFITDDSLDFDFVATAANDGFMNIIGTVDADDATGVVLGWTYLLIDQDNVTEGDSEYQAKIFPQSEDPILLTVDLHALSGFATGITLSFLVALNL